MALCETNKDLNFKKNPEIMSIALHGVFDPSRVEEILNSFAVTIEKQSAKILALENELSVRPNQADFNALHGMLQVQSQETAKRFVEMEKRIIVCEHIMGELQNASTGWNACVRNAGAYQTIVHAEQSANEIENKILNLQTIVENVKRETLKCGELEKANILVLEQLKAIQSNVACKVDRVELPLLKLASDSISEAALFHKDAENRLSNLQKGFTELKENLIQKEDKDTMVLRMQKISEQLNTKADITSVLSASKSDVEASKCIISGLTSRLEELQLQITSMKEYQVKYDDEVKNLKTASSKTEASKFVSLKLLDATLESFSKEISAEMSAIHDLITALQNNFAQLQSAFVTLDSRTNVCVKFVDWYADTTMPRQWNSSSEKENQNRLFGNSK